MKIIMHTERTISDSEFELWLDAISRAGAPAHVIESLRDKDFASWEDPNVKTTYEVLK